MVGRRRLLEDPGSLELCYDSALRAVSIRWHGETELRRKLSMKGFDPDPIEGAIERLRTEGYLDDERYATSFARSRMNRGIGSSRVRMELQQRGVGASVAASATTDAAVEIPQDAALERLVAKRATMFRRRHGDDWRSDQSLRKKFLAYLLNQGYDYAAASAAMKAIGTVDIDEG